MSRIVTKSEYCVKTNLGNFKLFVACHDDNTSYAGILYYNRKGNFFENTDVFIHIKSEVFTGQSAEEVFDEASNWIKSELDPNADIIEL